MFKKFKNAATEEKNNRNQEITEYFSQLKNPSISRKDDLYYLEMQQLAFNLVRYLRMETKNNSCQGNWNMTYLEENMSKDDYMFVARKFLGRMTATEWKDMIGNSPFREGYGLLELVEDKIDNYSVYEIKYKPKLKEEKITYVDKPDLYRALAELEKRFELEKIEYKLFS
jgi:hypothetical protein